MATSWTYLTGSDQRIIDTNSVRLNCEWKEETVGSNNRIHVRYYVCSKYRINGTWNCQYKINNTLVYNESISLSQGNNTNAWNSSVLVGERYVDLSKTQKSVAINLIIKDFDYTSVSTGAWTKKDFTQDFTLTLTNTEIIPNNPAVSINSPDDGQGRNSYESIQLNGNGISGTFRVYPCQTSSGSGTGNKLQFYIGMPGNGSHTRIRIGKYVNGQGWNDNFYDSGWKTDTYHKYERSFYSGDRYDQGVAWRVWTMVKSSTGNEKSSDSIYFAINDQPSFSNGEPNISCTSIIVPGISNFAVSWNSAINSLYQSVYTLRYKRTEDSSWNEVYVGAATSTTINLSNQSVYSRGKTIQFQVLAQDKYDADTSFRGSASVKINSLPTLSSSTINNTMSDPNTYNNHYDTTVTFTLPSKSDVDGQSTIYKLDYKVGSGGWTTYNSNYTGALALTINCSNYQNTAGGSFQLRVTVNDGLEDGDTATSAILYKNTKPSIPSSINYTPSDAIHSNTHAESITNISWSSINNICNGRPVPSYEVIKKTATSSTNNGSNVSTYNPSTNNVGVSILDIVRGEYFWFEIVAIDIFGYRSDTYVTPRYRRNRIPSSPSPIVLNQGKLNVYKTVPLTWTISTDPDGDVVKYKLEVKKGNSAYELISNSITANSYTHDITGYAEGLTLKYKVTPYDDHNIDGQSVETTQNIVVNTRPLGVNIVYPTNIIYNRNARLLLDILNDIDGDDLTLNINVNGVDYTSNSNSQYFSNTSYRPLVRGVFKSPTLNIGNNTIKTKSHDGYQYSDEKIFTITVNNSPTPSINTGDIILGEHMNGLNVMVNNYYSAYGCTFGKKDTSITVGSNVFATKINDMYDNIISINNTINSFSSDTKFDKTIAKNSVSSGDVIGKQINTINDILKDL